MVATNPGLASVLAQTAAVVARSLRVSTVSSGVFARYLNLLAIRSLTPCRASPPPLVPQPTPQPPQHPAGASAGGRSVGYRLSSSAENLVAIQDLGETSTWLDIDNPPLMDGTEPTFS